MDLCGLDPFSCSRQHVGNDECLEQGCLILIAQAWKQTSGNPSSQTLHYRGVTLLYNFTTALQYMVSSLVRIVARLLNIY